GGSGHGWPPSRLADRVASELPGRQVPGDVAVRERGDHLFLELAVPEPVPAKLVLVLGGDVDLRLPVAVEVREKDRMLEARGLGFDLRRLPRASVLLLEEPDAG